MQKNTEIPKDRESAKKLWNTFTNQLLELKSFKLIQTSDSVPKKLSDLKLEFKDEFSNPNFRNKKKIEIQINYITYDPCIISPLTADTKDEKTKDEKTEDELNEIKKIKENKRKEQEERKKEQERQQEIKNKYKSIGQAVVDKVNGKKKE